MAYEYPPGSIKGAWYLKVFPARVGIFVDQEIRWLETVVGESGLGRGSLDA